MRKRYQYNTSCVQAAGSDIVKMLSEERTITFQTMLKNCDGLDDLAYYLGYVAHSKTSKLRLSNDPCVSFHKSYFRGQRCYYVEISRIEYIFTKR